MAGTSRKYGLSNTRLWKCWRLMNDRSKTRSECSIYKPWLDDFMVFLGWALSNGYDDTKVLCRNGDNGDYTPDNCRWDTKEANNIEARAQHYTLVNPDGEQVDVYNLNAFCKEINLNQGAMSQVISDKRPHHKQWRKA